MVFRAVVNLQLRALNQFALHLFKVLGEEFEHRQGRRELDHLLRQQVHGLRHLILELEELADLAFAVDAIDRELKVLGQLVLVFLKAGD